MKKNKIKVKLLAGFMTASMAIGLCPAAAFAVTADHVAADGTYTKTAHVVNNPDYEEEWAEYDVEVSLTVKDGEFSEITVTPQGEYDETQNSPYFNKAVSKSNGIKTKLEGQTATENTISGWDAVTGATCTSNAVKAAALDAIHEASEAQETDPATPDKPAENEDIYAIMNIPYADFYKADLGESQTDDVDVVASATKTKSKKFENTYFSEDGDQLKGIKMAVKIDADTYKTLEGKVTDAAVDYYISEILTGTPDVYKTLEYTDGNYSFSQTTGTEITSSDVDAVLETDSPWGDYSITFSEECSSPTEVYGAYLNTDDGMKYGLRHMENIWSMRSYSEIAWSSGIVLTEPHGCTLAPEHYKDLMGKTIKSITWICKDGIRTVALGENGLYVPVKNGAEYSIEDTEVSAGTANLILSEALPAGFDPDYSVEGLPGAAVNDNNTLTWDKENAFAGGYTLVVKDKNGKNATKQAEFVLTSEKNPAQYNNDDKAPALIEVTDSRDGDFENYIGNIKTVSIKAPGSENAEAYNASGRGSLQIIREDGTVDTAVVQKSKDGTEKEIFAEAGEYEITVEAAGYPALSFNLTKEAAIDTAVLEEAVKNAEALKEADYTADSWAAMQAALNTAKDELNAPQTQTSVDEAALQLNDAVAALVKTGVEKPTDPSDNNGGDVTGDNGNNVSVASNAKDQNSQSSNTDASARTGDDTNLLGIIALALASMGGAGAAVRRKKVQQK